MNYDIIPIDEIIRKCPNWFSEDSKRFFDSLWNSYALKNKDSIYAYFVSSEKHTSYYPTYINEPRKYTIRKFNMRSGDFSPEQKNTIFVFQNFETKDKAEKALRSYLEQEPIIKETRDWIRREIKQERYNRKRSLENIENLKQELIALKEKEG